MKIIKQYHDKDKKIVHTLCERQSENPGEANAPAYLLKVIAHDGNHNVTDTYVEHPFDDLKTAIPAFLNHIVENEAHALFDPIEVDPSNEMYFEMRMARDLKLREPIDLESLELTV